MIPPVRSVLYEQLLRRFAPTTQAESVPQLFFGDAADTVQEIHAGGGKHQMVRYNPQAISFIRNNYINEQLRKR